MEKVVKVLIADSSEDFRTIVTDFIEGEDDLCICGAVSDGEAALEAVTRTCPDVLVTELLLSRLDGLSLIKELKSCGRMPHTIVVSGFYNDGTAAMISRLGVDYYFPKPCKVQELIWRIRECAAHPCFYGESFQDFDPQISEALLHFGVMPHLQGYRYLRDSIRRMVSDKESLKGVTKILYPELAKKYHTTPKCVERSMRNAIDTAWRNIDVRRRNEYFGGYAAQFLEKPTNSRLIATIAEFVEYEADRIEVLK